MNQIFVNANQRKHQISRHLYGHFAEHLGSCVYGGIWVGEDSPIPNTRGIRNDVVQALRQIRVPNIRWPGGCFAEEYHWQDGIGPRERRPSIVNTNWGGVTENNHFGTHEFFDLCEQIGCEAFLCGNVGSGTVREMQQWVEYCTCDGVSPMADLRRKNGRNAPWRLPLFGVGNENWGCGGRMRPEYYADVYKRYQRYIRNFGDNQLMKIACGAEDFDEQWTEVLMREAACCMNALDLHYYALHHSVGFKHQNATGFTKEMWGAGLYSALLMDDLLVRHSAIMDRYDAEKRVAMAVAEWGVWHNVEPGTNPKFLFQQNTIRDALIAGMTLNIFNKHCERVRLANLAQMVNVLQAVILTDGPKMVLTPTYHVFDMYKVHQDATLLPSEVECPPYTEGSPAELPQLHVSASRDAADKIHVSVCNLHHADPIDVSILVRGANVSSAAGRVLTAPEIDSHNPFENPDRVRLVSIPVRPVKNGAISTELPARSVSVLELS